MSSPPTPADCRPRDGSPITNVPLGGGAITTTQAVVAAGTCFQLIAFKGAGFGTTNLLCGVPGVSTLAQGATAGGRTAADALADVTQQIAEIEVLTQAALTR